MKSYNILLISLSGILILINFLFLAGYGPEIHRWGRLAGSFGLLAVFLKEFHPKKTLLLFTFLLFLMADVVALNYDKLVMQQAFFALQSLAYVLLIFRIGRYLLKTKLKTYQKFYFSLVLLLNSFFVVIIGDLLAEEVRDSFLQMLFYIYGISAILFISCSILYYDRFANHLTTAFILAAAGLVLSNLMGFSAHFLGFDEFFYVDRFFYILGLAALVAYSHYFEALSFSSGSNPEAVEPKNLREFTSTRHSIEEHVEEHNYL